MNKNFIPEKFLKIKAKKEEKSIKRGFIILLLGNLLVLPININNIMQNKNLNEDISLEVTKDKGFFDFKKEVIKWAEILETYSNLGEIKNNSGEMLIKNNKSLEKIKEKTNIIKINNDERGYFIDVVGDERWKSFI